MPDSSDSVAKSLTNVLPRNAFRLLTLIRDSTLKDRAFVAARYAETATFFEETLSFLVEMRWVTAAEDTIGTLGGAADRALNMHDAARNLFVAEALLSSSSPYRSVLASYLSRFGTGENGLVYSPTMERRLADAAVRDFLMDLGAVSHSRAEDFFVLGRPFAHLAVLSRGLTSASSAELAKLSHNREQLGRKAELAVLEWERSRVGMAYRDRIAHVARDHPFACFDIQSVSLHGSEVELRFIEVKAVAGASFEFHWSAGEIEAAQLLGDRYFLYLLPVAGRDSFDTSRLEIVRGAYTEVLRDDSAWAVTPSELICRKRVASV